MARNTVAGRGRDCPLEAVEGLLACRCCSPACENQFLLSSAVQSAVFGHSSPRKPSSLPLAKSQIRDSPFRCRALWE